MAYVAKRNPNRCPAHPGALLREDMIPAVQMSVAEIARLLGISRQHLYDILAEKKPVSPNVAVLLGKLFGDGPGIWVRMQAAHDTWHAERECDVHGIPTLKGRMTRAMQTPRDLLRPAARSSTQLPSERVMIAGRSRDHAMHRPKMLGRCKNLAVPKFGED